MEKEQNAEQALLTLSFLRGYTIFAMEANVIDKDNFKPINDKYKFIEDYIRSTKSK